MEVVRVEQLEAKESQNDLEGERATVHKVAIEQLFGVVKICEAQELDLRLFRNRAAQVNNQSQLAQKRIHKGLSLRVSHSA